MWPKRIPMRFVIPLAALLLFAVPDFCCANAGVYKPPKVRELHDSVLDTSNEPIANMTVTLMRGDEVIKAVVTNDAGEFDFGSFPDGKCELDAVAKGFQHARYLVILGHQTNHWKQSITIKLAFGGDQCGAVVEVPDSSPSKSQ